MQAPSFTIKLWDFALAISITLLVIGVISIIALILYVESGEKLSISRLLVNIFIASITIGVGIHVLLSLFGI
ncbi:MAG: hypothetical protein ACTSXJ_01965 [Candidatus Baldrarchaeia archaeon]